MCSKHIPITNGMAYKGIIKATCMCMWTNKEKTAYRLCSDPNLSILFYNTRMNSVLSVKITVQVWCALLRLGWVRKLQTLNLTTYQLYRLDCSRHGGRVLMYVHKSYSCKVLLVGPSHRWDHIYYPLI